MWLLLKFGIKDPHKTISNKVLNCGLCELLWYNWLKYGVHSTSISSPVAVRRYCVYSRSWQSPALSTLGCLPEPASSQKICYQLAEWWYQRYWHHAGSNRRWYTWTTYIWTPLPPTVPRVLWQLLGICSCSHLHRSPLSSSWATSWSNFSPLSNSLHNWIFCDKR